MFRGIGAPLGLRKNFASVDPIFGRPEAGRLFVCAKNPGRIAMEQSALKELYIDELRDIYDAENQLTKALPKMAKAATSDELKAGFEKHLEQTKGHVERLEEIFETLGEKPTGKKCKGMQGLIAEGKEIMEEDYENETLDAGLISAAQRVEHYEIAAYGCVRNYANILGEEDAVNLLQQTLDEEKETDQKLTELAETINVEAAGGEGAESSEEEDEGEDEESEGPRHRSAHAKSK
jgi:ferritin-like metal-binding protein YciE